MSNYEFLNNNEAPSAENAEGKTVECVYAEFTDRLIYTAKRCKKLVKKSKKTNKKLSKQIKKEASYAKELHKKVEVLSGELKEVKQAVANFKKTAREGLFKELAYCDDVSERKRLIAEIQRVEGIE